MPNMHAFEIGQFVEYLSTSHHIFLPGNIVGFSAMDGQPFPCYDVQLFGGKVRPRVPLTLLRQPLDPQCDEAASMMLEDPEGVILREGSVALEREYTERTTHWWQQSNVIERMPFQRQIGIRYRMSFSKGRTVVVPATYVRREFPAGMNVEVYLGILRGWVAGEVIGSGDDEEDLSADGPVNFDKALLPPMDSDLLLAEQWQEVRLKALDEEGLMRQIHTVPSYLVMPDRCVSF